jgi:hypothetical protein
VINSFYRRTIGYLFFSSKIGLICSSVLGGNGLVVLEEVGFLKKPGLDKPGVVDHTL